MDECTYTNCGSGIKIKFTEQTQSTNGTDL